MAIPANLELGAAKTTNTRDAGGLETGLSPRTGRLYRALDNHFESLILFTIAVVLVTLSGSAGTFTAICAWVYVAARVVYVPAYAFGWQPWRSLIWGIGFTAVCLMVVAALIQGG